MNTTATIKAILGYAQPTVVGVAIATLLASQSAGLAACPNTAEDKSNSIMACKSGGDCTKPSLADQTICIFLEPVMHFWRIPIST